MNFIENALSANCVSHWQNKSSHLGPKSGNFGPSCMRKFGVTAARKNPVGDDFFIQG